MKKKFEEASAFVLISVSMAVLLMAFFRRGIANYTIGKIFTANDSMRIIELSADDFSLSGMEKTGQNLYYTTDGDPQMITNIDTRVQSIKFYAKFSRHPGEMIAYYTTKQGQGFSPKKRLSFTPVDGENGWYEARVIAKHIYDLRIDPTMYEGVSFEMENVLINEEKDIGQYLKLGYGDVFNLVIYCGILSSCLKMIQLLLKREIE